MASVFQIKKFSEIKHLLPPDSWWMLHNNVVAFGNDNVIFFEGNTVLDNLNLDFTDLNLPVTDEAVKEKIALIVVDGNLRAKNIYNKETDGAISLSVLGNLEADNISVGGQEIYVAGNLVVDWFWGEYNHGDLRVAGNVTARVFMATEEYHFYWNRFYNKENTNIDLLITDDEVDGDYPRELMESAFEADCLVKEEDINDEIYGFGDWLDTMEIARRLEQNIPILLKDFKITEEPEIPFVFESEFLSDNNMERFRNSFLFSAFGSSPDVLKQIEFWRDDIFTRVSVTQSKPLSTNIYLQYEEEYAVMLFYFQHQSRLLRGLTYKWLTGDDTEWHSLDMQNPPSNIASHFETGWKQLLKAFSAMEYYQQVFKEQITVERITDILSLPLIKDKYSGYYSEEEEDLHIGNLQCSFRQKENIKNQCPRVCIIKSIPYKEEDERYVFYLFDIKENEEGVPVVKLRTQDADGYDSKVYTVSVTDTEKYKDALKFFATLEKKALKLNSDYIREQ